MQVPLLDLKAQYQALREPILAAVDETFASGAWIMGPKVKTFEEEVASYVHAKAAIGCASGTDALPSSRTSSARRPTPDTCRWASWRRTRSTCRWPPYWATSPTPSPFRPATR